MREILFRGKRVDIMDAWAYGFYAKAPSGNTYITETVAGAASPKAVYPDSIGQYTGRADVHDNRVFEGDIINVPGTDNAIGVVRFGNHPPHVSYLEGTGTGFYIDWQGEEHGILRTDIGYWLDRAESVVIGNIYDNPELVWEVEKNA